MFELRDSDLIKEIEQEKEYRDNVVMPEEKSGGGGKTRNKDQAPIGLGKTPHCPCCLYPLVARMGRSGPGFFCACHPYEKHGSYS